MGKCVYRYNDYNREGDGVAEIVLCRRLVIKETACYLWHIHPPMGEDPETFNREADYTHCVKKPWYKGQVVKTRKGAHRSAWAETPEKALSQWRARKAFQLKRLRLQLERVELCVAGYDALQPKTAPESIPCGKGPQSALYDWRVY